MKDDRSSSSHSPHSPGAPVRSALKGGRIKSGMAAGKGKARREVSWGEGGKKRRGIAARIGEIFCCGKVVPDEPTRVIHDVPANGDEVIRDAVPAIVESVSALDDPLYAARKQAAEALTDAISAELGPKHKRVMCKAALHRPILSKAQAQYNLAAARARVQAAEEMQRQRDKTAATGGSVLSDLSSPRSASPTTAAMSPTATIAQSPTTTGVSRGPGVVSPPKMLTSPRSVYYAARVGGYRGGSATDPRTTLQRPDQGRQL